MEKILYINKTRVELGKSRVTRKVQIGDVGDISKRKSSFSYSVKLPFSAINIQVFEMLGTIGNTSRKPFESLVIDYVINGIALISNGSGKIRQTSGGYVLNIYDGIIDLGERLGDKKLSELPMNDLNHILTTQTYIDSMSNSGGYIYAIADFGLGIASTIKVETQAPLIYTHTLFSRIFETAGLNLIGDFFTANNRYLTEVVTPSKGYEVTDEAFVDNFKGGVDVAVISDYKRNGSAFDFEESVPITDDSLIGASVVGNKIVFSIAGVYKLRLNVDYSSSETFLYIKTNLNGSEIAISTIAIESESGSSAKVIDILFTAIVDDEINFDILGSSGYNLEDERNFYAIDYSLSADIDLFLQSGGQLIEPVKYLSDIKQIDFVIDVIQRHGLLLHPIQQAKDYRFKQLEEVLNNRRNVDDWTDKIRSIGKEKYNSGYAQTNEAVYQYPEEIAIPNNDGEMLIDNVNAEIKKTIISSPFQIPNKAAIYDSTEQTYFIPIWEVKDAVVELLETPIKTMRVNVSEVLIEAALFTEVTSIEKGNAPFLSLDEMSMQVYFAKNYKAFRSLVENYKEKEVVLNLTPIDVFNLDFFKLKFLKQTGRYYYLNNVIHQVGKLSKANMIEVFEFLQNEPPSQVGSYSFEMPHDSTRTITKENILTDYLDPEFDAALKIKILSGWNSDLIMKQDGVVVSAETEILIEDLALTIFDDLGGLSGYSKSWVFTIADIGSGAYSEEEGTLTATVSEIANEAPIADAGIDQTRELFEPEYSGALSVYVNGGASYDNTGNIISYLWTIDSKPVSSVAYVEENSETPNGVLFVPNETDSIGTYTLRLTVEDEYGLTDFDTMEVEVEAYHPEE